MELLDAMLKRRSIRTYTGEEIPEETIHQVLQAGLLAPSSRNIQPCEFIIVHQKELLNKLAKCKTAGSHMLCDADYGIVVLGDTEKSDVWVEDCSIAMTYMHLQATALGIGSCWVQCRLRRAFDFSSEDYVKTLLSIPEKYGVVAILALGIPQKEAKPHTLDQLNVEKIHREVF